MVCDHNQTEQLHLELLSLIHFMHNYSSSIDQTDPRLEDWNEPKTDNTDFWTLFDFQARWQVENLGAEVENKYTGDPWIIEQCLQFADLKTQYTVSLYWSFTTMTTVGYGDILPSTNMDR